MNINTFFYSIKQGICNIGRNKMFSLASVATMSACIFMFGLFYIILTNFNNMVKRAEEGVAVNVFFEEGLSQERIDGIGDEIKKRAEVSKVDFISAEAAWEDFQTTVFEGHEEVADTFKDDNPLVHSAHYEIYLNDVSMQESLVQHLEKLEGVREVKHSEYVANILSDFNRMVGYVSVGIILILLCVAVFLISNTVATGISVRKEEIGIMKLIGATDFLVRSPFVVEGIVIGFIGACLPLLLLYFLYGKIVIYIGDTFNFLSSMMQFVKAEEVFGVLVPAALLLGMGIGFMGSIWTVRKHLKV